MHLSRKPRPGRYMLFRADDRLLHGQVALGWGRQLNPRHYLIADDRLSADEATASLYRLAAPEGVDVRIATVSAVAAHEGSLPPPAETVLLVRGLAEAALLLHAGVPGPLNLGGLHLHADAREVLPYVFLSAADRALLLSLLREGREIYAQDLPQNARLDPWTWFPDERHPEEGR